MELPRTVSQDSASETGESHRGDKAATVSIIVPVLNEAEGLRSFLEHLGERAPGAEIIVVDGGSDDGSLDAAAGCCDRALRSPRGRAAQMNAGAKAAAGEVFWFVHADTRVPEKCLEDIEGALRDPHAAGGCFRLRFPRRELIYRLSDSAGNLAVDLFGRAYGDHGIFCRRSEFFTVGGYPDLPIMEDAELYRNLRRRGVMRQLRGEIIASPRRYEEVGPVRLTAAFTLISILWILRVPHGILTRIYNRFCRCGDEAAGRK